jgi:hypothetical protein
MKTEEVLYNAPEAAEFRTNISGWVSRSGRFWGKDEHMARWEGCTHIICKCGQPTKKDYTICEDCRAKQRIERYNAMPFKQWDGQTPLCLANSDQFFWSEEDIDIYLDDNELKPEDLRLVICEPNYMQELDAGYWDDVFAVDMEELPKDIEDAMENLNRIIHKRNETQPISWGEGKFRTEYKPQDE